MAYSTYGSFADLLRQAKTQSQLRGTNLLPNDIKSMGSGYFSDALNASNSDRAYNLAEAQQTLAEQQATAQTEQYNQSLAQNAEQFEKSQALSNDQFAKSLAQSKAEAQAQQEAADKAQTQGNIQSGVQTLGTGLMLAKDTIANLGGAAVDAIGNYFAPTAAEAARQLAGTEAGEILGNMAATEASNAAITSGSGATMAEGTGAATEALTGGTELAGGSELAGGASTTTGSGASITGVATPAAFVALGSSLHNIAGAPKTGWDEKTVSERHFAAPATTATLASTLGDPILAPLTFIGMNNEDSLPGKITKEVSRVEQQVMTPINWLFGDK
ncbi:MAG: hypothetical protein ABFD50_08410 [Smithella sp.]